MVALGAELLAHEPAVPRRLLPVDRARVEARQVLAQRVELRAVAEVALRLHAQHGIDRGEMQRGAARRAGSTAGCGPSRPSPCDSAAATRPRGRASAATAPRSRPCRAAAGAAGSGSCRVVRRQRGARQRRGIDDRRRCRGAPRWRAAGSAVGRQRDLQVRRARRRTGCRPASPTPSAAARGSARARRTRSAPARTAGTQADRPQARRPARQWPATAARPPPPARRAAGRAGSSRRRHLVDDLRDHVLGRQALDLRAGRQHHAVAQSRDGAGA